MTGTNRYAAPSRRALIAVALAALAACSDDKPKQSTYPGIAVSATSLSTVEGGADVPFQVSLTVPPSASITVQVTSGDTTEGYVTVVGSGYSSSTCTLTFGPSNWNVPQTVAIDPRDDTIQDGNQTYNVTLSIPYTSDPAYQGVAPVLISVTNGDNDVPGFTLSKTTANTSESGTTTDTFTVTLNVQPSATVTIPVTSTDPSEGLLSAGATSNVATVNLTFTTTGWSTAQTVTIRGQPDLVDDGNQTYSISVGPPTGAAEYAVLGAQQVSVTNVDVDTAGVTVLAPLQPLRTSENGTTASFTVRLNTQPVADVVVPITSTNPAEGLVSGAAQGPASSISLTFTSTDWATPKTVTVTGQDDSTPSDNVTYAVNVGPPTGSDPIYPTLPAQQVNVLNVDNDVAMITVPEIGTTLITSESGTTATFSIVLNKQPGSNVVVPVTVNDATEGLVRGGSSPAIPAATIDVTFTPADFATAQIVTVVGQPDMAVDGNQTYTIAIGPATGDAEYLALPAQSISVTNSDVDVAGFTLSRTTLSHNEGATTTFTVRLNTQPSADVVIPVTSGNPAAGEVSGGSLGATYGTTLNLTFTPGNWQTAQTVSVRGTVDHVDEDGTQTYTITVGPTSSADTHYQGLAPRTIAATCYDMDVAGFTVTPMSGLVTTESGGTATFTVRLDTIPLFVVTIPVNISDTTEALISGAAYVNLSFNSSNWNTPQVVTVTGFDDGILDGTQPWSATVGPTSSGDTHYSSLAAKTVTGSNTDNEVGQNEGTIAAPGNITGLVPYRGQVGGGASGYSYYMITGVTSSTHVTLTGVTDDVRLDVYQSPDFSTGLLCTSNAAGANASESCYANAPTGGTLYIRVSGTATLRGAAFTVDFTTVTSIVEVEPNNTIATANGPYAMDSVVIGAVSPTGDVDYIAVANNTGVSTSMQIRVWTGGVGVCSSYDPTLTLYSSGGTELAYSDDYTGMCPRILYTFPAYTTYYAAVRGFGGSSVPAYQLQISP